MKAAVFLDRDNTLITNDGDLGEPDAVRLLDGVPAGLRALREAGFRLIVVTNQAGVARGAFTEDAVDAVHQRIAALVDEAAGTRDLIDRFYYCPYHPEAPLEQYRREHPWRKPGAGMLMQAARDLEIDLGQSWMVGDQPRDIEAGRAAGCRTILLSEDEERRRRAQPTAAASNFAEAVAAVLSLRAEPEAAPAAEPADPPAAPAAKRPIDSSAERSADPAAERSDAPRNAVMPEELRAAVAALTDEMRSARLRKAEFSAARLAAGMCQLLAVLLALLGLLQLGSTELFFKWMLGATLAQLLTITIMLLDLRG